MSSDVKIVGYCRACGKALDEASARPANGTIYCEEHAITMPPNGGPGAGTSAEPPSPYTAPTYHAGPPPMPNSGPSPGLAFLLGFIPGVGAIYNGQYGKGLVHVIIIGLTISVLANNQANGLEPLLSLLLSGFWFYMAFEAYHTAKKRQLGQPVDEFSSLIGSREGASRIPAAPLLLIGVGVVFLLNNLDIIAMRQILRFWPVSLIGLGVYMLYARMTGPQGGDPR